MSIMHTHQPVSAVKASQVRADVTDLFAIIVISEISPIPNSGGLEICQLSFQQDTKSDDVP